MELKNNPYSAMQKRQYDATFEQMRNNHSEHNDNPDYWELLLLNMREEPEKWEGKKALDFGSGQGRNIIHMFQAAKFECVDGVDISEQNNRVARENIRNAINHIGLQHPNQSFYLFTNNGYDLEKIDDDEYDLVISTITLQHICVHTIRFNLMQEIHRVLKHGGTFSFQMGFGGGHSNTVGYLEDNWEAQGTNSYCDVRVEEPYEVIQDLLAVGFENIQSFIVPSRGLDSHEKWIFVKCTK